ncbi:MAG: hypothetical protein ACLUUF_01920 [Bifidobacterium pullorum]
MQLETASGAASEPVRRGDLRARRTACGSLPVKTTDDLFIMRPDRFHLDRLLRDGGRQLHLPERGASDPRCYKNIHDFDERFPYSACRRWPPRLPR